MALGTTLSAATTVSGTLGTHDIVFNSAGISATQAIADAGGNLTVCLMAYHLDYSNNAPVQDGDNTQIRVYYVEAGGGNIPKLLIENASGGVTTLSAESSGSDDDSYLINNVIDDGSVSWDTVRGDVDTVGSDYSSDSGLSYAGIYARKSSGRGGDVITIIARSYFVFDLSAGYADTVAVKMQVMMSAFGTQTGDFPKIIAVQATTLAGSTADFGNCFVADVAVTDNATFFGANF